MQRIISLASVALLVGILSACTAMTTISAKQTGATIDINKSKQATIPRTESFPATSFGNYEFRAQAAGLEPFYGVLPLKFNGGYLATDILFFAPAMFFNLREVEPFYEFDVEKKVLRFKKKEGAEWSTYVPLEAEAARAKAFFTNK